MTDPFAALIKDIEQDFDAALSDVETDANGGGIGGMWCSRISADSGP
jgi:hypothetical protein